MEHTREPWIEVGPSFGAEEIAEVTQIVSCYGENDDDEGHTICCFPVYIDKKTRAEDARRIVACVNACAGMKTERLETLCKNSVFGKPINEMLVYFGNQRNDLYEALKERSGFYYKRDVAHQYDIPHCLCRKCTDKRCNSALANCKEFLTTG